MSSGIKFLLYDDISKYSIGDGVVYYEDKKVYSSSVELNQDQAELLLHSVQEAFGKGYTKGRNDGKSYAVEKIKSLLEYLK